MRCRCGDGTAVALLAAGMARLPCRDATTMSLAQAWCRCRVAGGGDGSSTPPALEWHTEQDPPESTRLA